jgi:hypothetical protein
VCVCVCVYSMVKRWMLLLLLMTSFYVKIHEGGRNGYQKDGGGSLRASTNTG